MNQERSALTKQLAGREQVSKVLLEERRKEQKAVAYSGKSGLYIPHVYQVFNDPDFDSDISELRAKIEKLYYKNISLTATPSDEHILLEDVLLIKEVADKYRITFDDLGFYADGKFDEGLSDFGRRKTEFGGLQSHWEDHANFPLCYVIGPKTSLEDIEKDWPFIREYRKETLYEYSSSKAITRSKSPENPELIYAVFKARMKGLKYSEVFEDYQDGKLCGYKGSSNQYNSEDSLERYYRKYMPQVQKNELDDSIFEKTEMNTKWLNGLKQSSTHKHLFKTDT